jgi:segregation and condensation protein A
MSATVRTEIFEGPLDLLLHLIKKNEVNIADIPIATITEQYLATLELMQAMNLDVAGEFLVMAATLIHIKSKMLLPPGEHDDEEDEGEDPRADLVRQLLEYQRYKEAAGDLEQRELLHRDVFTRSAEADAEGEAVEFEKVSLFDLITALRDLLERLPRETLHEVILERVSLREQMSAILDRLQSEGSVVFQALFETAASRLAAVVTFLAMLELVKSRALRVRQAEALGPIWVELAAPLGESRERIGGGEAGGKGHGA